MVDLHHHLLPGLDDGSPDLETSVAMARIAVEDGITHVVCTPHANHRYPFDYEVVQEKLTELRATLAEAAIPLTLGNGCDFHINFENIQEAKQTPARFSINGLGYLLIELPDHSISPNLGDILYDLRISELQPILTHPERNPVLQRDLDRMTPWIHDGLLLQVTAGSVLGDMGRIAEKIAHQLLERRWVHFLATDAHDTKHRPPRMAAARDLVSQKYGADYAELLCTTNPQAVFDGRPLPEQPEPRGVFEDDLPMKESFWKRLFRL